MHTLLLIIVTIIWGSTFFVIKSTVANVNEYFIVFSRTFIPFIVMLPILFLKNKKDIFNKEIIKNGIILGIFLAMVFISQTIGLKYTTSGHSAFITGTAVIIVPIILFTFFKYKISKTSFFSIVTVFIGLFLLTYDFKTRINIGDLITLTTALAHAIYIILVGRFVKKTEVFTLVTYQFLAASILSLILFLLTKERFVIPETKYLFSIFYLGIICTLFCYFIAVWVQKYVDSIKVAIFFALEPLFAVIFGYFILAERLNTKELVGAILILAGIFFYQTQLKKNKIILTTG